MQQPRQRKPRFQRVSNSDPLQLTDRDFAILTLVSEHRLLQSHHLVRLLLGSEQHLIRRLGRLFHAGFLDRPKIQRLLCSLPQETFVYTLTELGRKELQERGVPTFASVPRLRSRDSALSLTHDLFVSEVVVALRFAAENNRIKFQVRHQCSDKGQLTIMRWGCRISYRDIPKRCLVIPDATFTLEGAEQPSSWFFLEFDRGTMPVARRNPHQTSFLRKVLAYKETRQVGILWKRNQISGFRVLVVTESRPRLDSLRRITAESFRRGESTMFLFVTLAELLEQTSPFEPVWQTCSGQRVALLSS